MRKIPTAIHSIPRLGAGLGVGSLGSLGSFGSHGSLITLLSPARDKATAIEAIRHGADAVYMGAERFGARVAAGNSVEDIAEVCQFAHLFGARVYVTLNTILYDDELPEVEALTWELYRVGVDALIVQDMAFLRMNLPPIALHASTQMDNRTSQKVEWLRQQGFSQAVLARELTLEEISRIHADVPGMPLEVFLHGSICVCYNGQCYASQHCFQRSANRGACAQFCRLPFDLVDDEGHTLSSSRHLLSLHDMNRSRQLEELLDAGVTCLKIEGRLKDVGYVKNVTAFYSRLLDEIISRRPADFCRSSKGRSEVTFEPRLERSFNRGFTDYFLHGRTADLIQPHTPKSMGECVGRVMEVRRDSFRVDSTASFANGDGLCFIDAQGALQGFRVNRVEGSMLYPLDMPRGLQRGVELYRNFDQAFEKVLSRPTAERRINVLWSLAETSPMGGEFSLSLTCEDGITASKSFAYPAETARTPQRDNIERQLRRMGDTPFAVSDVTIHTSQEWFIPSSVIGEWRRTLTHDLIEARLASHKQEERLLPSDSSIPLEVAMPEKITPEGALTYQANVANRMAKTFYLDHGATAVQPAFELDAPAHATIMTTRYCLRHELGLCLKDEKSTRSGLRLRLGDGREFRLKFDCKRCLMHVLSCLIMAFMLTSCYYPNQRTDLWDLPEEQQDSIDFLTKHHYSEGYNFDVWADSIQLQTEIPQLAQALVDSPDIVTVREHDPLVVADIYIDTTDVKDSVWIKVARDQVTQGWLHESELLPNVVPDDPISQAIMLFSGGHIQWTLAIIIVAMIAYIRLKGRHRPFRMPHYNDICSPYPTTLCLLMSGAAVLYASIQQFAPQTWADYFFHPTLNPFALPPILGAFVASVWLMVIFMIAVVDDVTRQLPSPDSILYLLTLFAFMGIEYVVFSISTLYYVGYPLFIVYLLWAAYRYIVHFRPRYRCGNCGMLMHDLKTCERCGAENR